MKVAELIEELEKLPEDLEVFIWLSVGKGRLTSDISLRPGRSIVIVEEAQKDEQLVKSGSREIDATSRQAGNDR